MNESCRVGRPEDPDRYGLGKVVMEGGEGTVYKGWVQVADGRIAVAIKVPLPRFAPHIDALFARWSEQVELLRSIRHPGIVTVRETFIGMPPHRPEECVEGRDLYLVMDWVEGVPLDAWLLNHPNLNHLERARSVSQIAAVLDKVHALRLAGAEAIVHRDVKPNNIIMTDDDSPVLVDWGLVRRVAPGASLRPGEGGPGFMAPEILSEGRFSPASDRFSFGCVVYFLLTGRSPPETLGVSGFRSGLREVSGLTDQKATVNHILQMFHPDPARRPTSCSEWLAGITKSTVIPVDGRVPPLAPAAPQRRGRLLAMGAAVAALVAVVILVARLAGGGGSALAGGPPSSQVQTTVATPTSSPLITTTLAASTTSTPTTVLRPTRAPGTSGTKLSALPAVSGPPRINGATERIASSTLLNCIGLETEQPGMAYEIDYDLPGSFTKLTATAGITDDTYDSLTVTVDFQVWSDNSGTPLFDKTVAGQTQVHVLADLTGVKRLRLVMTSAGNGSHITPLWAVFGDATLFS